MTITKTWHPENLIVGRVYRFSYRTGPDEYILRRARFQGIGCTGRTLVLIFDIFGQGFTYEAYKIRTIEEVKNT